jgi:transposase
MTKNINVLGVDLAKSIFQLDCADSYGKRIAKKRLNREKFIAYVSNLPPCLIGIEACGSSHYWARKFQSYGHEVRMIASQFVKPFVMSNKNDANDARAISEAVIRPEMRFVPIKTLAKQELLLAPKIPSLITL